MAFTPIGIFVLDGSRIIRSRPKAGYTILPNSTLQDRRLQYIDLGILVSVLSRPADWECRVRQLVKEGDGRDKIRNSFRRLRKLKYVSFVKRRTAEGHIESVYYVFDRPEDNDMSDAGDDTATASVESPEPENPAPDDPAPEKPDSGRSVALHSTDAQRTELQKTEAAAPRTAIRPPPAVPAAADLQKDPEVGEGAAMLAELGVKLADAAEIIRGRRLVTEIKRLTPSFNHRKRRPDDNPGGWWWRALKVPGAWGPDEAGVRIEEHRASAKLSEEDRQGKELVDMMNEDEIAEAHALLIEHYRRQGRTEAVHLLQSMRSPKQEQGFWRAVWRNRELLE